MPQCSFILKEPKSKSNSLIFLIFRFNKSKLKFSTGERINPKFWNTDKQRAKEIRTFREHETINFMLNELEAEVNNTYRRLILEDRTPTPELIRARLHLLLKKENYGSKDLAHFAETILEASSRTPGTKKTIRQTIRNLKEFRDKKGNSLHFDAIDLDFYDQYLDYAKMKGYSQNTIGTHIKNIKVFMREAFERGLTKNNHFRSKRFKKTEEESQNIYLSLTELKKLHVLEFDNRLERVKDLFLVGCYTGLRFSDLTKIKLENIQAHKHVIKISTQKTGETVVIPINSTLKNIIEKYQGKLPTLISNVKMNEYLKEMGLKAGFTDPILITSTIGGEKQTIVYQKWQLITTHTARRSFATNAFLENVPTISIMKITGHKTEKSFLKYIKISQEDNANKLIHHPFFQ